MRRAWFAFWLLCSALLLGSSWRPESSTATRLLSLFALGGLLTLPPVLASSHRHARRIVLASYGLAVLFLISPGRDARPLELRAEYLHALRQFDGTHYVWGGETHRGIDCSGLVRVSLLEANLALGLTHLDAGLLREAFALWWFDASASALGSGYRGWTKELSRASSLRDVDLALLQPGDLAVTSDGLHVLAYLGDATWTQADPLPMRVHVEKLSEAVAPAMGRWFTVPVTLVRWRALE